MNLDNNTNRNTKAVLFQTAPGVFHYPIIDASSHHLIALTDGEHEIHSGRSFSAQFTITTAATIGHRSGIFLKTPTTPQIHMLFVGSASTAANLEICEAPTIAKNTGSHGVAVFNHRRDSAKESTVFDNATSPAINKVTTLSEAQITGDGSWSKGTVLPGSGPMSIGAGPRPAGGVSRDIAEYILKANTKYVILATNTASSANDHLVKFNWYEHIDL